MAAGAVAMAMTMPTVRDGGCRTRRGVDRFFRTESSDDCDLDKRAI